MLGCVGGRGMIQAGMPTVQELVNEHEVVLNSILVELAEIPLTQANETVEKLKDNSCVGVAFGHRRDVDVLVLDMAESGRAKRQDGRAYLSIRDDLDAKDVGQAWAAVRPEGAENQVLALLVEEQDAAEHGRLGVIGCIGRQRGGISER